MVGNDFIDLLSSDEDAPPVLPAQKPAPRIPTKPLEKSTTSHLEQPSESRFLGLSNDFDDNVLLEKDYASRMVKRRKLSSSLEQTKPESNWMTDGFAVLSDDESPMVVSSAYQRVTALESRWKANGADDQDAPSEDSFDSLPEDILDLSYQATSKNLDTEDLAFDKTTMIPGLRKEFSTLSDTTKAVLASFATGRADERQVSEVSIRTMSTAYEIDASVDSVSANQNAHVSGKREETDQMRSGKPGKRKQLTKEGKALRDDEKTVDKVAKAQDRQRLREQKAQDKEVNLQRKRLEKEEKAKKKQKDAEIAEVNKAKLDKKDSTPEMIVDLPASIDGDRLDTQTREFLKNLEIEASQYQSSIPNVIKWRRKVKAKYNQEEGLWEPLSRMQIEEEKHVMCIMPATEFISLATTQDDDEGLDTHVEKLRRAYQDCIPIYLIEGLTKRIRESKTAANRTYQNKVLNQGENESASNSSQTTKRKKATATPLIIDEDAIEDALLRLQVMHGTLIHHTSFYTETAEWIATFTQHISTIPYKHVRMNLFASGSGGDGGSAAFCMEPGQIKTGLDKADTYAKMLQSVIRVTPAIAQAIVDAYPTVVALMKAFRAHGPLVLRGLRKVGMRDGGGGAREVWNSAGSSCVGQALSRRLHGIFMGQDPDSVRV